MKKWLIVFGAIIAILIFAAFYFNESESKFITEITYSQLVTKVEKNEKFILYIKNSDCSHCEEFNPDFLSVLREYDLNAFSIYTDKLSDSDEKLFNDLVNVDGTPTVLFFENGQASFNKIEGSKGSKNKEIIIKKLINAGYITESDK